MDSAHPTPSDSFLITSRNLEETNKLGKRIGTLVSNRMVLALTGELGSGKTSFVQGLANGLDVPEGYYITSPSFTLINEYPGRHRLFHVDLYRMDALHDLEDIGLYDILEQDSVVAIEWADKLSKAALLDHILLRFEIAGENSRNIAIIAFGRYETDLLKKLKNSY
jgi:tRNA threonylcarbamoyladenosine biosynthesis protein TsaE